MTDRQKLTDMRQMKDDYEHRLTRLTKTSKVQINRLVSIFMANFTNNFCLARIFTITNNHNRLDR